MTEDTNGPSMGLWGVDVWLKWRLQLTSCSLSHNGVKEKFTQRSKLTLNVLFDYFCVYLSVKKRENPIHNWIHRLDFLQNILSRTPIEGEAQGHL